VIGNCEIEHRVGTVGREIASDLHAVDAFWRVERPSRQQSYARERDAIVVQEIGGPFWMAMAFEIAGARANHAMTFGYLACDQRAVRKISGPHDDIHIFGNRIDLTIGQTEVDRDPRMLR